MCICDISVEDEYVRQPLSASVAWVLDMQAARVRGRLRFLKPKREARPRWRLTPLKDSYEIRFYPKRLPELWFFSAENAARKKTLMLCKVNILRIKNSNLFGVRSDKTYSFSQKIKRPD
ncbi:hypothetical protein L328_12160 [Yersinia pestis 24H]|nr:hypothetical protein L328_12160 [Yersinia pestis 24H]